MWTLKVAVMALAFSAAVRAAVDVPALLKQSVAATERDFRESENFIYTERDIEQKLDAKGRVKSTVAKTYEVTMIDGTPYRRLLKMGERPLTPAEALTESKKLDAERARRVREPAAERARRIAKYRREHQQDLAMLKEMAQGFVYTLAGEETVNGRPAYVLEAAPKPGYNPRTRDTKVLTGMRGKLWIDKAELHWLKVEAEVTRPVSFYAVASVSPGTRFLLEQQPVGGGIWQPRHFAVRVNSNVLWMARNSNSDELYSGYHRAPAATAARAEAR